MDNTTSMPELSAYKVEKIDLSKPDWKSSREFFEGLADELRSLNDDKERYDFSWVGKRKSIIEAGAPINKTLRPDVAASKNFDTTENLYIEGDNLDALKLLQESYLGKVKMIYIDPPYNTGKDFVYHDNFTADNAEYQVESGKKDKDGNTLVAEDEFKKNARTEGRFHSDWLSMMYPRLKLARNLLSEDGVIFISIDDNEQANLKLLCDEVFGETNFVNKFVWINNLKGRQIQGSGAAGTHEEIYCYARNILNTKEFVATSEFLKSIMPSSYKGFDYETKEDFKGKYIITNELYNSNSAFNEIMRPNLVFDIYYRENDGDIKFEDTSDSDYVLIRPHKNANPNYKYHAYRWSKNKILAEKDDLEFVKDGNTYRIYTKRRDYDTTIAKDIITDITTSNGGQDLKKYGIDSLFCFPKPVELIKLLLKIASNESALILDFFSGSATTADAVMQLNAEDGGMRRFILVQLPEETPKGSEARKADYTTIPEIARERIRRAGDAIVAQVSKPASAAELPLAGLETGATKHPLDIGFRYLKIDSANEKEGVRKPAELFTQDNLPADIENTKADRSDLDLLYGVLCQSALEYNRPIKEEKIGEATIYLYDYSGHGTGLVACFTKNLTDEVIQKIVEMKPLTVVFRDASFPDSPVKVNVGEKFRVQSPETKIKVI